MLSCVVLGQECLWLNFNQDWYSFLYHLFIKFIWLCGEAFDIHYWNEHLIFMNLLSYGNLVNLWSMMEGFCLATKTVHKSLPLLEPISTALLPLAVFHSPVIFYDYIIIQYKYQVIFFFTFSSSSRILSVSKLFWNNIELMFKDLHRTVCSKSAKNIYL